MGKAIKKATCRDLAGKTYEVDADQLKFRPSVYGVAVKDGKIMLSKQYDGYDFPGGGVDLGETLQEALVREYKEETGFDISVGDLLWYQDSFYHDPDHDVHGYWQSLLFYYRCEVVGGEPSVAGAMPDEQQYIDLPEWVDLAKAKDAKWYTTANVQQILSLAQKL